MMRSPLPKSLERYRARVENYSDERCFDAAIFVQYARGWQSREMHKPPLHADSAYSVAEMREKLRAARPCDCQQCKR